MRNELLRDWSSGIVACSYHGATRIFKGYSSGLWSIFYLHEKGTPYSFWHLSHNPSGYHFPWKFQQVKSILQFICDIEDAFPWSNLTRRRLAAQLWQSRLDEIYFISEALWAHATADEWLPF